MGRWQLTGLHEDLHRDDGFVVQSEKRFFEEMLADEIERDLRFCGCWS